MIPVYDAAAVAALLDYPGCIAAMREAMIALAVTASASAAQRTAPLSGSKATTRP